MVRNTRLNCGLIVVGKVYVVVTLWSELSISLNCGSINI